jgi:hypothetical protein
MRLRTALLFSVIVGVSAAWAHQPPGVVNYAFAFPTSAIPTMDGDLSDWDIVPEAYWITRENHLVETVIGNDTEVRLDDFNARHILGWNEQTNRMYVIADIFDDYFKRDKEDPQNVDWDDGFDFIVDADHSGGDLWNAEWHAEEHADQIDLVFVNGQNYRLYTPPLDGYYIFMLGRGFVGNDNFLTDGRTVTMPQYLELGWSVDAELYAPGPRTYELMFTPWENMYRGEGADTRSTIVDLDVGKIVHVGFEYKDFDVPVEGERYSAAYDYPPTHDIWRIAELLGDFELLDVDTELFPSAVETDTWGRIKSDFLIGE